MEKQGKKEREGSMEKEASWSCYNVKCGRAVVGAGKSGWRLSCGGAAKLCRICASLYDEHTFCNTFHLHDDGWRPCKLCKKLIHCGCIASIHLFVFDDTASGGGGIHCLDCFNNNNDIASGGGGIHYLDCFNNMSPPPPPPPLPPTKRHPRHKPDCVCIVCNQPPSGYKHPSTCHCTSCQIIKRRLETQRRKRSIANKKIMN
ncbi:hypothetical protein SUGI_0153440 [Cryptomeria japonica]|nr:hypothetical protein SUGI_0153440 [Cryptomeria japonica]